MKDYKRMYDLSFEMYMKAGCKTYAFLLPFSPPYYQTHDPKNVEYILQTKFDSFKKGKYVADRMGDLLGNGIFAVDGHLWRFQRKTASHIFSINHFKEYLGKVFSETMGDLDAQIQKLSHSPIDVHELLYRFTLDIFGKIGFGISLDCLTNGEIPFGKCLERCQDVIRYRFHSPTWKIEEFIFFWKRRQMKSDIKMLQDFVDSMIQKKKSGLVGNRAHADLLFFFMKSTDSEDRPLSDELIQQRRHCHGLYSN